MKPYDRYLHIPCSANQRAYIPLEITQDDMDMIRASLDLWEKRIVRKYPLPDSNVTPPPLEDP